MTPICPTKLIRDAPSKTDELGAHSRISAAIVDLVKTESGGRSISLVGRYGSGKSTVINLVKEDIEQDNSYLVWVFDTWAHEGDPLRRSFLESLVAVLSDAGWVDAKRWRERVAELAGRRKHETRRTIPRLSGSGWALVAAALLIPIGSALFAHGLREGAVLRFAFEPHSPSLIGLVLMLAPVWVALYIAVRHRKDKEALGRALSPFVRQTVNEVETHTIATPDPTSLEFEREFADLVGEALSVESRRLILVIDNLDRIGIDTALGVWATLQTFVQHSDAEPFWFKKLWTVVPYDEKAIARLWKRDSETDHSPLRTEPDSSAAAFLDKSFQIRFDVPAPLLTDWQAYLKKLLRDAFPNHKEAEFHSIYRLFDICRHKDTFSPSPRSIKIFVNQVGAIHREWCGQIPLVDMAYYILLQRTSVDAVAGVLAGQVPRDEEAMLLGADIETNISALAFGVDPKHAGQILLETPILTALGEANGEKLSKLESAYPGFGAVLENAVRKACEDWLQAESSKLLHAACSLAESGVLERVDDQAKGHIQASICRAAAQISVVKPLTEDSAKGIAETVRLSEDPAIAASLFGAYQKATQELKKFGDDAAKLSIRGLLLLKSEFDRAGLSDAYRSGLLIPSGIEGFFAAVSALAAHTDELSWETLQLLRSDVENGVTAPFLVGKINDGSFDLITLAVTQRLSRQLRKEDWNHVASSIQNRLQAGQPAGQKELVPLLRALVWLTAGLKSSQALSTLVAQGHLAHQLHASKQNKDQEAVGYILYILLSQNPALSAQGSIGQAQPGYAIARELVEQPPDWLVEACVDHAAVDRDTAWLFASLSEFPAETALPARVLDAISERSWRARVFQTKQLVEHWDVVSRSLDVDGLMTRLVHEDGLVAQICEMEFSPKLAGLATALVGVGSEVDPALADWSVKGLKSLSEEDWAANLEDDTGVLRLGVALVEREVSVDLDHRYRAALEQHALQALEADVSSAAVAWPVVHRLLDDDHRSIFRDELYEVAKKADGKIRGAFFRLYGPALFESEKLRTEDSAITKIFLPLLDEKNQDGVIWLARSIAEDNKWLKSMGEAYTRVFRKRVSDSLSETWEAKTKKELEHLAATLGIQAKKKGKKKATAKDND